MPSRRTAALALTLALSGVVACTAPDPAPSAPEVSPERSVPATGDSAPATSEPIVIVTHATAPPEQMTVSRARRVMQGEIPAEIVAAPDLATGEGVEVARSPAAALRAVEKGTHRYGVVPAHALKPTVRRVRVGGVDPLRDQIGRANV